MVRAQTRFAVQTPGAESQVVVKGVLAITFPDAFDSFKFPSREEPFPMREIVPAIGHAF